MKTTSYLLLFLFLISATFTFSQGINDAEEQDNTLEIQFKDMKAASNNYQIYKVVKTTSLDKFWKSVEDTLKIDRDEKKSLKAEVAGLNNEVKKLEDEIAEREADLKDQEYQIDHMSFLGSDITKASYITITWIIIFALLVTSGIWYFRFKTANKITRKAKSEYDELSEEFENHRKRAREIETKIKRDLQTEINTVQELKQQLGQV